MRKLSSSDTAVFLKRVGIADARVQGFAFADQKRQLAFGWHKHTQHQLLVALSGSVRLEVEHASYVLPPQRAAFIPAGLPHLTIVDDVRTCSVYLARSLVPQAPKEVRVVLAHPLLQEMVAYAARWPPARSPRDEVAEAFFRAFGLLCSEWLREPVASRMPRGESREVRTTIDYLRDNLLDASLEEAAARAHTASRTLRRKLAAELGTSFRELLTHARLVRAMELLAAPERRVSDVAFEVGYTSLSAFAKSFAHFAGETPSAYRARVRSERDKS